MLNEFKDFIAKGNVMDMAVGIIIGAAFTAIVQSLVGDLINPIIGLFLGVLISQTSLLFYGERAILLLWRLLAKQVPLYWLMVLL